MPGKKYPVEQRERALRIGAVLYAIASGATVAIHSPMGGNVARLGTLFAGPVIACALLGRTRVSRTRTLIVTYLLPVTALIYAALLLGETIQAQAIAGLVLVLAGITITSGGLRLAGRARRAVTRPRPLADS